MDSRFKEWVYIEGLMQSAYHEAALKMNLSDSEFWILYVFNFHQEGCNQSVLYKEACLTKSTVNSAIRKMEQKWRLCGIILHGVLPLQGIRPDLEAQGEVTERTDSRFPLRHYSQQKRVSRVNCTVLRLPLTLFFLWLLGN